MYTHAWGQRWGWSCSLGRSGGPRHYTHTPRSCPSLFSPRSSPPPFALSLTAPHHAQRGWARTGGGGYPQACACVAAAAQQAPWWRLHPLPHPSSPLRACVWPVRCCSDDGAGVGTTVPVPSARSLRCPYLDTINRPLLDFDFEKVCVCVAWVEGVWLCGCGCPPLSLVALR